MRAPKQNLRAVDVDVEAQLHGDLTDDGPRASAPEPWRIDTVGAQFAGTLR